MTNRTYISLLSADVALRFRFLVESTAGSSADPSRTSDTVRLADGPAQKSTTISQGSNSTNEQKARQKWLDAHLSQYVPQAQLRAAEIYSDNFQDQSARKTPNQLDYSTKVLDLNYSRLLEEVPPEDAFWL